MAAGKKRDIFDRRWKGIAAVAVLLAFIALAPLLPLEYPLFPGPDSEFTADRLLRDGKCEEGYAIYERNAAKSGGNSVLYLSIGKMKLRGKCGESDVLGAIEAFRAAATLGSCEANYHLAQVKILRPEFDGADQVDEDDNLFASVLCSKSLSDSEVIEFYSTPIIELMPFDRIEDPLNQALERRAAFKGLPKSERLTILENIRDGVGFDANPYPYERLKNEP